MINRGIVILFYDIDSSIITKIKYTYIFGLQVLSYYRKKANKKEISASSEAQKQNHKVEGYLTLLPPLAMVDREEEVVVVRNRKKKKKERRT